MSTGTKGLPLLLALVLLGVPAAAQEDDGGLDFALGLGLGVESFGEETYQKVSLAPDFAFGKVGLSFELTLHYQFVGGDFKVRVEDWVGDDFQDTLGLYLSKFRYVRYGHKGDPLFAKFGSIDDGTLGNGFIMGGYANTLFLPERRIFGLSLDLDGSLVGFPYVGLETHAGDLSALDVLGTRLFVRPLIGTDIPILRNLQVGGTFAMDRDPFRYTEETAIYWTDAVAEGTDPDDAQAYAIGADLRLPIVDTPVFTLAAFTDGVTENLNSYGGMVGIGGRIAAIFTYGAQIRLIGDDFVPVYFDPTYDLTRAARYNLIEGSDTSPGYTGWFATLGTSLLGDLVVFRLSVEDSFGRVDDDDNNYLNFPHTRGVLIVNEGLLPGFFFDASYDKVLLREPQDLWRPEGALVKARLNYRSGPAVISFFYLLKYNTNDWTDPEVSSGLETLVQLN